MGVLSDLTLRPGVGAGGGAVGGGTGGAATLRCTRGVPGVAGRLRTEGGGSVRGAPRPSRRGAGREGGGGVLAATGPSGAASSGASDESIGSASQLPGPASYRLTCVIGSRGTPTGSTAR